MVSREGIEPPTCPLGGGRSIQLSYRDILPIYFEVNYNSECGECRVELMIMLATGTSSLKAFILFTR